MVALVGSTQIGLPLVDARGSIVKGLSLGSRSTKGFKYSDIKPSLDHMVGDARQHLHLQEYFQKDDSRFQAPSEYTGPIDDELPIQPPRMSDEALKWSR